MSTIADRAGVVHRMGRHNPHPAFERVLTRAEELAAERRKPQVPMASPALEAAVERAQASIGWRPKRRREDGFVELD